MKRFLCFVLLIALMPAALAGGLLPSTDELLGTYMPTIESVLGEYPREDYPENVRTQLYRDFDDSDYDEFSRYLGAWGCTAEDVSTEGRVLSLDIVKDGVRIAFKYDREKSEATLVYGPDARPEKSRTYEGEGEPVLPPLERAFGVLVPDPGLLLELQAEKSRFRFNDGTARADWLTYSYTGVDDAAYVRFGVYAAAYGLSFAASDIVTDGSGNRYLSSDLKKDGLTLNVLYSVKLRRLTLRYSENCYMDTVLAELPADTESVLPSPEALYVTMPTIAATLRQKPEKDEILSDGSRRMAFGSVGEDDFNAFSVYLGEYGCELIDVKRDGDEISATLGRQGESFTMKWESDDLVCELIYPAGTRVEQVTLPGDSVVFGAWEQNGDASDGSEPIEWTVLRVDADGSCLLLSKYALDCKAYNETATDITWESCSLRAWLNRDFFDAAFSFEEREKLIAVTLENADNRKYGAEGGKDTVDMVFLLGAGEAAEYLVGSEPIRCAPTAYAKAGGVYTDVYKTEEGLASCAWWLRSPGQSPDYASIVIPRGEIHDAGNPVTSKGAVRPAVLFRPEEEKEEAQTIDLSAQTGCREGDIVTFGRYEQDNDLTNGKEPIEWIVLDVQGDKALLISKYGLDAKPYNTSHADVTWETSSIRKWLNNDFLNEAFAVDEQKEILTTEVDNSQGQGYSGWSANGGNNTEDKIFLLSYAEANTYFGVGNNIGSRVSPTAFAINRGAYASVSLKTADGAAAGWWWLRSPGFYQHYAAIVLTDGSLSYTNVSFTSGVAHPAFWINLKSINTDDEAGDLTPHETIEGSAEEGEVDKPRESASAAAMYAVGDIVTFGRYEQDNNSANGREPIEWIVLDIQGDKALLISKYGLDAKPYNTSYDSVTWGTSSIRKWLNNGFLNEAFTADERKAILATKVDNSKSQGYSGWSTSGGSNTEDKIFLLSYAEANEYFGVTKNNNNNTKARIKLTHYAETKGAYLSDSFMTADFAPSGWWWLRSPGHRQGSIARVNTDGSLDKHDVNKTSGAVSPAFWINLESIK